MAGNFTPPSNVLIFGATSAVAAQVASSYAARGDRLHLVARNPEKLAEVERACSATRVTVQTADFADLEQNAQVVARALAALGRVDIALIAHGDLGNQLESERTFAEAERILR